jgi:hypothetical protein
VRRQGLEPRTRGLRVRVLTSSVIPGYVREYRVVPVHARQPGAGCRMVPAADGQYHGIRANNEQTCQRMILASLPAMRLLTAGRMASRRRWSTKQAPTPADKPGHIGETIAVVGTAGCPTQGGGMRLTSDVPAIYLAATCDGWRT